MADAATIPATEQVTTETATQTAAVAAAPAFVPLPKFKDMEAQARAYPDLEKLVGKKQAAPAAAQIPGTPPAPPEEIGDDLDELGIMEKAGVDQLDAGKEWMTNGKLTDEMYGKLRKLSPYLTKAVVNARFASAAEQGKAIQAEALTAAQEVVGGQKEYENLIAWARDGGVSESEWAGMEADYSKDCRTLPATTERLYAKHIRAMGAGNAQPLVSGNAAAPTGKSFTSQAEMLKAMNEKRYKSDRAYKASVDAKIAATDTRIIHNRR